MFWRIVYLLGGLAVIEPALRNAVSEIHTGHWYGWGDLALYMLLGGYLLGAQWEYTRNHPV